jgi:hypothetical protein
LGTTRVFQRRKLLRSRRTVMDLLLEEPVAGREPTTEEVWAEVVVIAMARTRCGGGGRGTLGEFGSDTKSKRIVCRG